jgi:hypothetical protein
VQGRVVADLRLQQPDGERLAELLGATGSGQPLSMIPLEHCSAVLGDTMAAKMSRKLLNDHQLRKAVILCDFLGRLRSTFMRAGDQALAV